jgi:hypothetical protein
MQQAADIMTQTAVNIELEFAYCDAQDTFHRARLEAFRKECQQDED